jgi:Cys-rich repeat protein
MDARRFDRIAMALAAAPTRRTALRFLGGGALGVLAGGLGVRRAAALRAPGRPCDRDGQCDSGICLGPRGRKKCRCEDGQPPCSPGICCIETSVCIDGACGDHCGSGREDRDETDVDCGGSRCPKCALGQRCLDDRDCVTGSCFNLDFCGCAVDGNCPVDRPFCDSPVCVQCRGDGDCQGKGFCVFGFCSACRDSADCPAARPVCSVNHDCVERCARDRDCPIGQRCRAGRCELQACRRQSDCRSGCCTSSGFCEAVDLSSNPSHCGRCGNSCPGQFPQCVMCCGGTCENPPRTPPPGNECFCP